MQNIWTLQEAINMVMKAEIMESDKRMVSYIRPLPIESSSSTPLDKGKAPQQAPGNPNRCKVDNNGRFGNRSQTQEAPQITNRYAKPTGEICYRCQKPGHRSNNYPERKHVNFVEPEAIDEEDEYAGVEFAMEEGVERLTLVSYLLVMESIKRQEATQEENGEETCGVVDGG
ncbi:Hypothetical predicted protein [Olea europaea subsp. europaea]|uniref:CCHC-type domain-containing protein n=1 Tax=Olea europaea subsp. europaea TaxID=158383 RepID=A0A8S0RPY8_OLEEU|nr:Hypothetical predicted protein [Olea europaea subsp. europaea]